MVLSEPFIDQPDKVVSKSIGLDTTLSCDTPGVPKTMRVTAHDKRT